MADGPLAVFQCAGHIRKTNGNTHKINACDIGIWNAFEACRFGGVGDLRFTMNPEQTQNQFLLRVEVELVTDFESKRCDDLRPRFCFEMFGGYFIVRIGCAQSSICVGKTQQTLKPFVLQLFSATST